MVMQIAKLCVVLVMPATNSLSERSFSALRHLKTWLRSTMNQSRLNWCMILHIHTNKTDKMDLTATANDFIARNSSQQSIFGCSLMVQKFMFLQCFKICFIFFKNCFILIVYNMYTDGSACKA